MVDLTNVATERRNERTQNFSNLEILDCVKLMNAEDITAVKCIEEQYENIANVIEKTTEALSCGGRIIYIGAGTSGRIGVLDAVECPPTFGVDYNTVVGLIAGGDTAFVKAKEGAEDSLELAKEDLQKIKLTNNDIVIGIAASGRTPYVIGGLNYAREVGAKTVAFSCSPNCEISKYADSKIELRTGAEVLSGSTRLKAGTATKLVLNMISTISMKGIGKVYKNLMVDVKMTNKKLVERGLGIVIEVTGATREQAEKALLESGNHVKTAIVMLLLSISAEQAAAKLQEANGKIQELI